MTQGTQSTHFEKQTIIVLETTMLLSALDQVAMLLSEKSIPGVYGYREHVQSDGLIPVDFVWCGGALQQPADVRSRGNTDIPHVRV